MADVLSQKPTLQYQNSPSHPRDIPGIASIESIIMRICFQGPGRLRSSEFDILEESPQVGIVDHAKKNEIQQAELNILSQVVMRIEAG